MFSDLLIYSRQQESEMLQRGQNVEACHCTIQEGFWMDVSDFETK
jgi:hypothetical protein